MENFRILDIRFNPCGYKDTTKRKINGISFMMGGGFSCIIERQLPDRKWMMPNTRILVMECANYKKEDVYIIGKKWSGWITEVRRVYMDEEDFLSRDEQGQMLLILDKLKEGFYKFVDLFPEINFDKKLIDNAYNQIIANDFYLRFTPLYVTKDEQYSCWIEMLPRPCGNHKYQLVLNGTEKYYIAQEEVIRPFKMLYDEKTGKQSYDFGETNHLYRAKKWTGHQFHFKYGKRDKYQKIIFDADKKSVIIKDKIYEKK